MAGDAAQREASRAHIAALLRDHHLPLPDAQSTHLRMDLGAFRVRWELHTEFVTWTFARPFEAAGFDERDPAVINLIERAIKACNAAGKYVGICGQGPSDHPDFARWLMDQGIDSISLNPDTVVQTWQQLAK